MRSMLVALGLVLGLALPASSEEWLGILFVGQSNMVAANTGPRDTAPGGVDALPESVFCLDRDDRIAPWHLPFPFAMAGAESGSSQNVSPAIAVAKRFAEAFPERKICVVFCAQSASGYNGFAADPGRNWAAPGSPNKLADNLYDRTVARARKAQAQGVRFVAGVHYLGESDGAVLSQSELVLEVAGLVNGLRASVDDMPFVLGSMLPWSGSPFANLDAVDAALAQVASSLPEVELARATGLVPAPDLAHFDTPSSRALGERMFEALADARLLPRLASPAAEAQAAPHTSAPAALPAVVLHQDFGADAWFGSYTDALAGGQQPASFSDLAQFESYRRPTGEFVLAAEWGTGERIVWRQTSNPLAEPKDVVTGFDVVLDPFGLGAAGLVDGLCRTSVTGAVLAFRRNGTSLATPTCALFLYSDYKIAQALGIAHVIRSPAGLLTSRVTLLAL